MSDNPLEEFINQLLDQKEDMNGSGAAESPDDDQFVDCDSVHDALAEFVESCNGEDDLTVPLTELQGQIAECLSGIMLMVACGMTEAGEIEVCFDLDDHALENPKFLMSQKGLAMLLFQAVALAFRGYDHLRPRFGDKGAALERAAAAALEILSREASADEVDEIKAQLSKAVKGE